MLNIVSFLIFCLSIVWPSTINLNQAELIAKNIFLEKNSSTKNGTNIESTITLSESNIPTFTVPFRAEQYLNQLLHVRISLSVEFEFFR